jgi:hypothetical protein
MSVEPCLLRLTPDEWARLSARPSSLFGFIEDGCATGRFDLTTSAAKPAGRLLHLDEFAMWLLTGFDEDTPACRALVGWDGQLLDGAHYGHGPVRYRPPSAVRAIVHELSGVEERDLDLRFEERADDFRLAAAGFFNGDGEIRAYQRSHFDRLREFYRDAAAAGDYVLLMMV